MKIIFKKLLLLLVSSLFIVSCEVINPDEPIPAYLQIDTIRLQTSAAQGNSSAYINDAWVFIDEKSIGAFELPATIPILEEGIRDIKILPGVILNGISGTRASHPFMVVEKGEVELVPGEINYDFDTITTTFQSDVVFPFEPDEDFEMGSIIFEKYGDTDTNVMRVSEPEYLMPRFGGNGSGAIFLDTARDLFEAVSINYYTLPKTPVFLEIDYKTDNYFSIGILPQGGTKRELIFIKPNTTWKKIYFNLTPYIGEYSISNFKIYITADLDAGKEEALILLDNLKLMHE